MGLLDQLWDDTLAGPTPDSGLGKLRKHPTFTFASPSAFNATQRRPATPKESNLKSTSYEKGTTSFEPEEIIRVSRRIMIVKPHGSPPVSPAASATPPLSPFSGRESRRFRRRSTSDAYEKTTSVVGPRTPTSCDM